MSDDAQGPTGAPPGAAGDAWPAGWYADPWYVGQQRYWDATAWTTHVHTVPPAPAPAVATPSAPPVATPSVAAPSTTPVVAPPEPWSAPTPPWSRPDASTGWITAPPASPNPEPYAPPWASGSGGPTGGWLPTDHLPPPPRRRRRGLAVVVAAVIVAVVAATITIASGSGEKKRRAVLGSPALTVPRQPSTTIPPSVSNDPSAGVLANLVVRQADVGSGAAVGLIPGGNLVTGQVTLDLCNGSYPSESLRTARRQVDVSDATGATSLSTEAVLYANAAATAQAFKELQARAANCPQTFLPPPAGEVGQVPSKTTFNAAPDGSWPKTPSVDRLAYDFTTADQQGNSGHSVAVYLRRGRVLMGVYFANPDKPQAAVAGQTTVAGIVGAFEKRIAALSAAVVNATVPVSAPAGSV